MNENQKKVLIATAIGLVIWSGYRLYIKRPIPPMRPVKSADASGAGSTNFTGYSDMTGKNGPTITQSDIEKSQVELAQINKLLNKGLGSLTTSQINKLREQKTKLEKALKGRNKMMMLVTDGTPMSASYGGDEQSNG